MASRRLRGVLLCEDQEHEDFFRPLLKKWFGKGKLRVDKIPNREGAGDAYVVANYPKLVQLARSKRFENYALIVAIDGDRDKLHRRLQRLDRALEDAGFDVRGDDDPIVLFVPTRNIETWELWLCGLRDIDEETDFKRRFQEAKARRKVSAKEAAKAWNKPLSEQERKLEEKTLPALAAGRLEIRRLNG